MDQPLTHVIMLLAFGPGSPEGDVNDRIEMTVALTQQGHVDRKMYPDDPRPWTVTRSMPSGAARSGELIELDQGWGLRRIGEEDDPIWPLDIAIVRPGEYVTLRGPGGEDFVFRIVGVEPETQNSAEPLGPGTVMP